MRCILRCGVFLCRRILTYRQEATQNKRGFFVSIISINYFPQDPLVSKPVRTSVNVDNLKPGPDNDRIDIQDPGRPVAEPDNSGNMVYPVEDPRFLQAQTFSVVNQALARFETQLGRKIKWSFNKPRIIVYPDKGEMLNAYYNRYDGSLNFFRSFEEKMGKTVFTGQSTEVDVHELGHAILDALRPSYAYSWSLDAKAFHESFADIHAIMDALYRDEAIRELEVQTQGDLKKHNLVAYMAEELGRAISLRKGKSGHDYTRDAINELTWKDPSSLPPNPEDETQLGREPHNYCRLFTGAFYDIMTGIYNENRKNGLNFYDSITSARDAAYKLIVKTLEYAPTSLSLFKQLYKAMLLADRDLNEGKYSNLIKEIFTNRKITKQDDINDLGGNLPLLYLPFGIKDIKSYQSFLDKNKELLEIPQDIRMKVFKVSTTQNNEQLVQYSYMQEVQLRGSRFGRLEGACVDIPGGCSLGFDKSGKLKYKDLQIVSKEDIKTALENIFYLINKGDILFVPQGEKLSIPEDLKRDDGSFYAGYVTYQDSKMKILPTLIII